MFPYFEPQFRMRRVAIYSPILFTHTHSKLGGLCWNLNLVFMAVRTKLISVDIRSRVGDLKNHRSVGPDNHVCYWYKF